MTEQSLYPLRFDPIFQYRLWGGRRLGAWMGEALPGDDPIGEAWLLSDRDDHPSLVAEGPLKGESLPYLMARAKASILGRLADRFDRFPLLLKFLDVREMLSVQVHPADDMADLIPKGETGKTEAWVVLEAGPDARIYAGLRPGATAERLAELTVETADDLLNRFMPAVGDAVLISAGTVHSLGDGVMVFEVQENSDITYRLYDWDHVDAKTGKPRDLQVDQAVACINFGQGEIAPVAPLVLDTAPIRREEAFDTAHFRVLRLTAATPFPVGAADEPRILVCLAGGGHVASQGDDHGLGRGGVMLLPASVGACSFVPDGPVCLLEIAVPDAA
jgi:mannose-6-phosphate isomerase